MLKNNSLDSIQKFFYKNYKDKFFKYFYRKITMKAIEILTKENRIIKKALALLELTATRI